MWIASFRPDVRQEGRLSLMILVDGRPSGSEVRRGIVLNRCREPKVMEGGRRAGVPVAGSLVPVFG
jgi:hypothetical protein